MVPPPFQTAHQHLEDHQSHTLSGEYEKIQPQTEYFSRENAFGIQQQHCIAITKSTHKMHFTIFRVGKYKRYFYNSSQL